MQEILNCLGSKVIIVDDFKDLSYQVGALGNNTLWVCDSNTSRMVRPLPQPNVVLDCGETTKNWSSVEKIIATAIENGLGRDCTFIALGGGVICDITSFAASIYMRGCNLVLIPTTLLCMVDASLGGKTGIDFRFGKNMVGTFFPANEILVCTDCLKSLSPRDFMNGFSEIIKLSLLTKDDSLFNVLATSKDKIIDRDPEILKEVVKLSLEVKKTYIEQDPFDRLGIRVALNLGHTFGHALESFSRMQWSHGQAVAWGVCKSVQASRELGLCTDEFANGVIKLFNYFGYDVNYRISRSEWLDYRTQLSKDKKAVNHVLNFILLKNQGEYEMLSLDDELIKKLVMQTSV